MVGSPVRPVTDLDAGRVADRGPATAGSSRRPGRPVQGPARTTAGRRSGDGSDKRLLRYHGCSVPNRRDPCPPGAPTVAGSRVSARIGFSTTDGKEFTWLSSL